MKTQFGEQPGSLPEGFLCAVRWPVMARVDVETGDGRILDGEGGGSAPTPFTVLCQTRTSFGHDGAEVSGAVFEMTIDTDATIASGRGFLLDNEMGRLHALYIKTGAMRGNSVDLRDVSARYEEDLDTGEWRVRFTKWKVGATTGVATPAFIDAHAEITASVIDPNGELMASIKANPLEELICHFETVDYTVDLHASQVEIPAELVASAKGIVQPYAAFHRPESEVPHKIIVDENGFVFGHLGTWESCHDGIEGQCTRIPRPTDGYASFNKPGVLTERGIVETGPIFAYGGHRRAASAPTIEQAYGGTENAWCDVRITEGIHGPWVCGVVRPGVGENTTYAARASRISGHWVGGRLKAIVSVNAEGFDVPGTGAVEFLPELAAGFAFTVTEGEVAELVAGFPPCSEPEVNYPQLNATASWAYKVEGSVIHMTQGSGTANGWTSFTPNFVGGVTQNPIILTPPNTMFTPVTVDEVVVEGEFEVVVDDEVETVLVRLLLEDDDES